MTDTRRLNSDRKPGYMAEHEYRQGGAVRPVDAATLIIVRRDGPKPRILLGRRSAKHRFMPNKYVFPGGRVDVGDGRLQPPTALHPAVLQRLQKSCSPQRARALAMAAIRETYEEAGIVVGEAESPTLKSRSPAWREFLRHDINPRLDHLYYIGRAITPPYRSRRFDTRFFLLDAAREGKELFTRKKGSDELLELQWLDFDGAQQLALPNITKVMLHEVGKKLQQGLSYDQPGPFIHARHGKIVIAEE